MTIQKINLQAVIDNEAGFELSRESRSYLRYSENDFVLFIEVESGEDESGQYNLAIYWPAVLKWNPPNDQFLISPTKRLEIKDRVDRSLKILDIPPCHIDT